MKTWCTDNGGHYRSGRVRTDDIDPKVKTGFIFSFFDEETAMAFCLQFGVNPNNIIRGIKR